MCDIYNKMIDEYEKFAKNIMFYNEINSGVLFNNLSDDKLEENTYGTYKNICNYGFYSDDNNQFVENIDKYLRKIIRLFNEYNCENELNNIKEKYDRLDNKSFYTVFCFMCEGIELLARTENMLYKFLIFISDIDFKNVIKNDNYFLESCIFVQRLVKLFREVIFLHWKRRKIYKRIM